MEHDRSLSDQQAGQFNNFDSSNFKEAPMKYDGKQVRGATVNVVSAPNNGSKKLIVPVMIVAVLIIAIVVIVIFAFSGNKESGSSSAESTTSAASAASGASGDSAASASESSKIIITFTKPDKWGDKINAYVYSKNNGGIKNKDWPGVEMKNNGDGTYSYEVPGDIESPLVVFNDGSKQLPKNGGFTVKNGGKYDKDSKKDK